MEGVVAGGVEDFRAKPFFVVNPKSANGATRERFEAVLPGLREAFPSLSYVYTNGPLHATTLAAEAACNGATMVASCGGDGTLNEVVGGLVRSGLAARVVLAVVPSGTGGDFRKVLPLGPGLDDAIACLRQGQARPADYGSLTFRDAAGATVTRPFVNIASCGISGLVDHYVNHTTKALGGKASFLIGTIRGMFAYRNVPVRVTVDGAPLYEGPAKLVAIGNGRFFGGGMMITPKASWDDGLFDVTVFGNMSKPQFLTLSRYIYDGTHLGRPGVYSSRGRVVAVEPAGGGRGEPDRALIDLDGEQPGTIPLEAEVVPAGLRLLVPPR
ncbi:MAG: diacylglycerol kinase family lipid kinase [Deltaproteobacteria bacterium]|nr:diacylglycerol kinase family lipid kinase [Deltaproteobacteria bacterium]